MTEAEHEKEAARLQRAITRARSLLKAPTTLNAKIELKGKVRDAEEALRQHRLNFFELTAPPCFDDRGARP